jgi:hypothetical protein
METTLVYTAAMHTLLLAALLSVTNQFHWNVSPPLVSPAKRIEDPCYSVKDPSLVFAGGRWHLFCTIRSQKRSHAIEYLSFTDWRDADKAQRHILTCWDGYFCAPQVFYFTPHKKWYLIFQMSDPNHKPQPYFPAFSTTTTIGDPNSWSRPTPLIDTKPTGTKAWLDFWVIADDSHAYLFFTSLDGKMWRTRTALADFPRGWEPAQVALRANIFEASHTYKLKGANQYLTLVEAQNAGGGWRSYKAFLADRLDGPWQAVTAPFASMDNTKPRGERWTDNISHIELLRAGCDERLEVDLSNLRVLFQGVLDRDRSGKKYGEIPWRLGLLEP